MSDIPEPHSPPPDWKTFRAQSRHRWATPVLYVDWLLAKFAWWLSQWSLLQVLRYAETFSVLVALIFWVSESNERRQQKHYQAWQVINTAQGKGGSGGRGDAMEQLNNDHIPLVGVDVAEGFLQGVHLDKAELRRATFRAADLRNAHFHKAAIQDANFVFANLRQADLRHADLADSTFENADLATADLRSANVHGVNFDHADLRGADLGELAGWKGISSIRLCNIAGVKNPPDGFVAWAIEHGAVEMSDTAKWNAALAAATPPSKG